MPFRLDSRHGSGEGAPWPPACHRLTSSALIMPARPASPAQMPDAPSETAFEQITTLRVRYAETDRMGVVYHANYLVWCEIGRTDFIRSTVASYAELEEQGVVLAVTEASLRFLRGARYDDRVEIRTRLLDVRSRTLRIGYEIVHADRGDRKSVV